MATKPDHDLETPMLDQAADALGQAEAMIEAIKASGDLSTSKLMMQHLGNAHFYHRLARDTLLSAANHPLTSKHFARSQVIRKRVDALRTDIIDYLNLRRARLLVDRIEDLVSAVPLGLSTASIGAALSAENKDIENAIADWKLALGAPAVLVWPRYVSADAVREEIRRAPKRFRRAFLRPHLWMAAAR